MPPRRRKPSRSKLALRWLGVAVLLAVAFAYVQPLRAYRDARAEVFERRSELVVLEREAAALGRRVQLVDDDQFVEREARRLGLVRPGERLFIVKGIERWRAPQGQGRSEAPIR